MTDKSHLDFLDLAKGIGILLVVLGHGMFPNHFLTLIPQHYNLTLFISS